MGLVGRLVLFEQLSFWLNPIGALLTVGFSGIFVVIFEALGQHSTVDFLHHIDLGQYYLPAFMAYGVMAACFNTLAITLVNRRETGLLKRLRLSPIPAWMLITAVLVSSMVVATAQIVLVLLIGLAYGVHGPHDVGGFVVVAVVGMASFTALGVGVSTIVPNGDSAGPVVSLVFFILMAFSGLYFPMQSGTTLANIAGVFPIRHLITSSVDTFNAIPGTSPWGDLAVMAAWGVGAVLVGARRWDWSPRRR
jgi:ABC-2 type transport system permease protein